MSIDEDFPTLLRRLVHGETLSADASLGAFAAIMAGQVSETRMGAFLTALAVREPTVAEIAGAARAMRRAMRAIETPPNAIDLCGTGGDGHGTLNVSTAAAFVVAACGVPVAKHGNRNMSSKSGAADVLEALGVRIDLASGAAEECLAETGLCFLFAPAYHPAMKHVAPVRKELGFRTVFNLLGPLCNPGRVRRQLLGVFAERWAMPVAGVLSELGAEHAWVVHGKDGMDELTLTGPSLVVEVTNGTTRSFEIAPEEIGLARAGLEDLRGGDAQHNAQELRSLLDGKGTRAYHDIVVLNAAAALVVGGAASDLCAGGHMAAATLADGAARAKFDALRKATHRLA